MSKNILVSEKQLGFILEQFLTEVAQDGLNMVIANSPEDLYKQVLVQTC